MTMYDYNLVFFINTVKLYAKIILLNTKVEHDCYFFEIKEVYVWQTC